MPDQKHLIYQEIKVSIGKGVEFSNLSTMNLGDIYWNFIYNTKGNLKNSTAIKELRTYVDQHIDKFNTLEAKPENERTAEEEKERKKIKGTLDAKKRNLLAFTWSGVFSSRNNAGLVEHSGRLQGDIDLKDKPRIESEQLRDRLGKDPHVEVAFLSPTARGVKIGILIPHCSNNIEQHQAFAAAERYFRKTYDVTLDPSRKDIAGLCFFSHDPEIKFNRNNPISLDIEKWSPDKKKPRSLFNAATYGKTSTEPQTAETEDKDEVLLDAGENRIYDNSSPQPPTEPPESSPSPKQQKSKKSKQEYDDLSTDDLVDILQSIQGADDRETWVKVGHALKEYLGDDGYPFWAVWSKQSSKWNDVDEGKNWVRWVGFNPTNINGIADLIHLAKEGGWTWKKTKGQKQTKGQQKTSAGADHPAQKETATSTGAETEATETDSVEETTPSTTTETDAGQTTKGNFQKIKNKNDKEVYVPNLHNVCESLRISKANIWYDTFTRQILTNLYEEDGAIGEWNDAKTIALTLAFQQLDGMQRIGRNIIDDAVLYYSREHKRNQLTDWLDSLQWDKTPPPGSLVESVLWSRGQRLRPRGRSMLVAWCCDQGISTRYTIRSLSNL